MTSCITGILIGVFKSKGIARKLFSRIGINIAISTPTAWDYIFSRCEQCWVEVFLGTGKVIRGKYFSNSLSSSDPNFRDIFLQELYTKTDSGEWQRVERTNGVWISPEEIKYIKFYEDRKDGSNV